MKHITIKHRLSAFTASLVFALVAVAAIAWPIATSSNAKAASPALNATAYEVSRPGKPHSFVTTSQTEIQQAAKHGFTTVRPIFMVSTTAGSGLVPVYRADATLQDGNYTSLLTVNKNEADNACKKYGFTCKGIAFYAQAELKDGAEMVYRMRYKHFNFRQVTAKDRQDLQKAGYIQESREWFYVKPVQHNNGNGNGNVDPVKDGKFSIAVYPDTQQEVFQWSGNQFAARTNWTVKNKEKYDIRFLAHTGDMVTSGGHEGIDKPDQYIVASNAFKTIDQANIPYLTTIGNHDTKAVCGGGGACDWRHTNEWARDTTVFNRYFSATRQKLSANQMFENGKVDNAYKTFTAEGKQWLVLTLELWPRAEAVNWAKNVVASHPKHNVIVLSHSLLNADGSIGTGAGYGTGKQTPRYVYDNLILAYPNIRMAFSGHVGQAASRIDTGKHGNKVASFLGAFHSNDYNPTRMLTVDTINNTVTSDIQAASIRDAYKAKYPNATLPNYDQYDVSYSGMNFVNP